MDKLMKSHETYRALPAKVSQQVLKQLDHDWDSFFKARDTYNEDPSKFLGRPKLPRYKHKTEGRNLLVYTLQALQGGQSKKGIQGIIKPSPLAIEVKTKQRNIYQVRIVPRKGFYVIEVVYEYEQPKSAVDPAYYAGIDIGMDNLVALTSN
jgi:putative transposase